jgi:hypothetical protein
MIGHLSMPPACFVDLYNKMSGMMDQLKKAGVVHQVAAQGKPQRAALPLGGIGVRRRCSPTSYASASAHAIKQVLLP